ncbi:MAG: ribonuclease HII [Bacteroidales bacterium]|nr:ribonuclease HII [Bacteroidales bacterium]
MEVHLLNYLNENMIEAGCDEAGRGPLAGPVFAAAVILPRDFHHPLLNDSKKMTEKARDLLRPVIESEAIAWAVASVSAEDIDRINILNASIAGMWRAVDALATRPEHLLIDGNRFRPYRTTGDSHIPADRISEYDMMPFSCIVKGDGKFAPIAAASVLAKTYRDEYMRMIAKEYPEYGWDRNMGYPTKEHIDAVKRLGMTPHHRKSFHVKELEATLF